MKVDETKYPPCACAGSGLVDLNQLLVKGIFGSLGDAG